MTDRFDGDNSATPLTDNEKKGLIPTHIALRSELNEWEQRGVLSAEKWTFGRPHKKILDQAFLCGLHFQMFKDVWRWAGDFRKTERNIGVDPSHIEVELKNLLDDTQYWIENKIFPPDEIAIRFHHRLVWIHPFPSGNGRHARLIADLLVTSLGQTRFNWGQKRLVSVREVRKHYIDALRAADNHNIKPLLLFARS